MHIAVDILFSRVRSMLFTMHKLASQYAFECGNVTCRMRRNPEEISQITYRFGCIDDILGLQKVFVEQGGVVLTRGVVVSRAGVHKHLQIDSANIDLIS